MNDEVWKGGVCDVVGTGLCCTRREKVNEREIESAKPFHLSHYHL